MADVIHFTPERVLTTSGALQSGAAYQVEFYLSGTTTPATVYQDEAGTIPHPWPILADATGTFPQAFGDGLLKAVIKTAAGATQRTIDPCGRSPLASTAADALSFDATAEIPASNVQDAIERVQQNMTDATEGMGLGVTGDAPLLANIDATNTAAGFWRFNGSTTGTFPSGVTASTGGVVTVIRRSATQAVMVLRPTAGPDTYLRELDGTWGAWQIGVAVADAPARGDLIYRGASGWAKLAGGGEGDTLGMGADDPAWVSGIKAWCTFDGTSGSPAVAAGRNVASVAKNGTGDYTLTFSTAMADTSYAVIASAIKRSGGGYEEVWSYYAEVAPAGKATGTLQIRTGYVSGTSAGNYREFADIADISVVVIR